MWLLYPVSPSISCVSLRAVARSKQNDTNAAIRGLALLDDCDDEFSTTLIFIKVYHSFDNIMHQESSISRWCLKTSASAVSKALHRVVTHKQSHTVSARTASKVERIAHLSFTRPRHCLRRAPRAPRPQPPTPAGGSGQQRTRALLRR